MFTTERLRILMREEPSEVGRELVPGHLHAAIALDHDGVPVPITTGELSLLGVTRTEAWELACANLRERSEPDDLRPVDTLPGLRFLKASDGLAASRFVLLDELLRPMPLGGVVVAVPEVSQLLCVPLDSARAIDGLQALASAVGHLEATRPYLLSDQLFWFDGKIWRPIPVHHGDEDITVLPPPAFLQMMSHLASMDWVQVAGEA